MNMQIKWDNSNEIEDLINHCYFENQNNGVLINHSSIRIDPQDVNYKILKGLDCDVKLKNSVVSGTLRFKKIEHEDSIELRPMSIYCIKEKDKYSFY